MSKGLLMVKLRGALAVAVLAAAPLEAAEPLWPTATWVTATPAQVGMDPARLAQARDFALTGGGAGYIIRGGKLVMTWGNPATRYELKSTTKSIAATALGLALKDGLVGLTDRAQFHLSEVGTPPTSNGNLGWLEQLTLFQLATHTAGFEFTGGLGALDFQPGGTWAYSDGGANWLGDALTVAYGRDLRTLMFERVFTPLGITAADLTWRDNAARGDTIRGIKRRELASGISADVDAMARIGYLYLRRGVWNGQRLLDESFVAAASAPVPFVVGLTVDNPVDYPDAARHYGLLWWNNGDGAMRGVPRDAYWSWGLYDSLIVVIPSLDIVAVRAGSGWRDGWDADYSAIEPFIKPIAQSAPCVLHVPSAPDADGDGFAGACDCDDSRAATYPGAREVNDGGDNDCPGVAGHGVDDEIPGVTGFFALGDRNTYSWPGQTGATRYDVRRSSSRTFTAGCWSYQTSGLHWTDPAVPPAGGVYFYLVRPFAPSAGSWGKGPVGVERTLYGCGGF